MTDLPLLGVAVSSSEYELLGDWIRGPGRAVEIQDFVMPDVIAGDVAPLVARWQRLLDGHKGPVGLHGPFFGLDLSNADREIRGIVTRRFLTGVEVAAALGGTHMVIHSPFTYWHVLNRANYPALRGTMMAAAAECLAPVLARAAEAGCTLVLENIDDTDPADRVDLVATIDHPNLRVSLDTGHADLAHGRYTAPPVTDFIAAAGTLLHHVHLQDVDGYADRHWHPGDGRIAWRPVFNALRALPELPRLILEVRTDHARLPETVARLEDLGLAR